MRTRTPLPPPPEFVDPPLPTPEEAMLIKLNNILEYTEGDHYELKVIRTVTPEYIKAIGYSRVASQRTRTAEFYFILKPLGRTGSYIQIISVLKRMDKGARVEWNPATGEPTNDASHLLDNMKHANGMLWRQGWALKDIQPLYEAGRQ